MPRFGFRVCAEHPGRPLGSTGVGILAPHGLDAVAGADAVVVDALLHLVRRELGPAVANEIARQMVVAPRRDGGQRPFVPLPMLEEPCDSLRPVLDFMIGHLDAEFDVARLAAMSERTFARRFAAETGTTPLRWLTAQRVLPARRLLEETALSVAEIAGACGLGSGALLRHHFRREVGLTPAGYRRSFRVEAADPPTR